MAGGLIRSRGGDLASSLAGAALAASSCPMPEGPEIRRAADRLAKAVVGERLVSDWFAFPALNRFEKSLRAAVIKSITPHGKALLTRFENGWTLYRHNQLNVVWRIAAARDG